MARFSYLVLAWLILSSFRIGPQAHAPEMPLLYDVRGAFVSAPASVSPRLVSEIDTRLHASIRATFRKTLLPRTIITVRIFDVRHEKFLVGGLASARISVEATAVGNGEKIAAGGFNVSAYSLSATSGESLLAKRIAERVATEFRLEDAGSSTLATALFP
ncbi:hypothetical protein ACFSE1_02905 [Rhizobium helianthi]|uniref:Uncharacterized protein n=1 Tax=Rhizobium helianthi TaxID=1132695 RepID=A0ABW4M1H0_9HYPH